MFRDLTAELLRSGHAVRFQADGRSMLPGISPGAVLEVEPVESDTCRAGQILLFQSDGGRVLAHRLVRIETTNDGDRRYITRGDNCFEEDPVWGDDALLGVVIRVNGQHPPRRPSFWSWMIYRIQARLDRAK